MPTEFCFICEKHRSSERDGYSIFENDLVYAGHIHGSENEIYLGHVVVEPKRHVEGLAALTAEEAAAIGQAVSRRRSRFLHAVAGRAPDRPPLIPAAQHGMGTDDRS